MAKRLTSLDGESWEGGWPRSSLAFYPVEGAPGPSAGGPLIRASATDHQSSRYPGLCPVHRGLIAMSGSSHKTGRRPTHHGIAHCGGWPTHQGISHRSPVITVSGAVPRSSQPYRDERVFAQDRQAAHSSRHFALWRVAHSSGHQPPITSHHGIRGCAPFIAALSR
jgi:hypothetical protein